MRKNIKLNSMLYKIVNEITNVPMEEMLFTTTDNRSRSEHGQFIHFIYPPKTQMIINRLLHLSTNHISRPKSVDALNTYGKNHGLTTTQAVTFMIVNQMFQGKPTKACMEGKQNLKSVDSKWDTTY